MGRTEQSGVEKKNGFTNKQLKPAMSDRFCSIYYVINNIPSPTKKLRKLSFCLFSDDVEFQKRKQDQRGKPLIMGTFSESLLFPCELYSKLCFVRCLSCVLK